MTRVLAGIGTAVAVAVLLGLAVVKVQNEKQMTVEYARQADEQKRIADTMAKGPKEFEIKCTVTVQDGRKPVVFCDEDRETQRVVYYQAR